MNSKQFKWKNSIKKIQTILRNFHSQNQTMNQEEWERLEMKRQMLRKERPKCIGHMRIY